MGQIVLVSLAIAATATVATSAAPAGYYLIPAAMIAVVALLSLRRVCTRLDVDGGAVVQTWTLLVPYRSRRLPFDPSAVREVRVRSQRRVISDPAPTHGAPSKRSRVAYAASLEGTSPPAVYRGADYESVRSVAEHFALGLGVPLRLSADDGRAPEEIFAPLRDRLARRLLPPPVPLKAGEGRLWADHDATAGITRIVLPRVGAAPAIVRAAGSSVFGTAMVAVLSGRWGLYIAAFATPVVIAVALFRAASSELVSALADGGLEVVRRFPIGRWTRRIAGDELDDLSRLPDHLQAHGRRRSLRFGLGLDEDERRWLERVLRLAIARRSEVAARVDKSP